MYCVGSLGSEECCGRFTIREVGLAEVQVIARPGWVVLGAQGEFHTLDVLFEVVERSKDVLHPFHAGVVSHCLIRLRLSLPPVLLTGLVDGQRLDHVSRRTLQHRGGHLAALRDGLHSRRLLLQERRAATAFQSWLICTTTTTSMETTEDSEQTNMD